MPPFIEELQAYLFEPTRLPTAMLAIAIVLLGGMVRGAFSGNTTPLFWHLVDKMFGNLGGRMDKPDRPKGDLIFRGFLITIFALGFSFFFARALGYLIAIYPFWSLVEIAALCSVLTAGSAFAGVSQLYKALNNNQKVTQGAYYAIARTARVNMAKSDDYTITRIGMSMVLQAFDKGIIAPIIWYLIGGLPVAFIYATLAALSWRFGRSGHSSGFGQTAMALERLMGFVPNMFSGLLIALSGLLTPTAGFTRGLSAMLKSKGAAPYEEGGSPVTVAAHALLVTLGGPVVDLDGYSLKKEWVGPANATAQLNAKHLHRVVYLCFMAHLIFLTSLATSMLYASGLNLQSLFN